MGYPKASKLERRIRVGRVLPELVLIPAALAP